MALAFQPGYLCCLSDQPRSLCSIPASAPWPALPCPAPHPLLFPPPACAQVSAILARNHCLFRHAVVKPDSLRRLFEWLRRDLALPQATIVRLLARCPLILQVGGLGDGWGAELAREKGHFGSPVPSAALLTGAFTVLPWRRTSKNLAALQAVEHANQRHPWPPTRPLPCLQADVDGVLKGRVQFLLDLDLTLVRGRRRVLPVLHGTSCYRS